MRNLFGGGGHTKKKKDSNGILHCTFSIDILGRESMEVPVLKIAYLVFIKKEARQKEEKWGLCVSEFLGESILQFYWAPA